MAAVDSGSAERFEYGALKTYYDTLLHDRNASKDIIIELNEEERQKRIIVARDIQKGDVILTDEPLVSIRHGMNKRIVPSCDYCHRVIGSIDEHVQALATVFPVPSKSYSVDPVCLLPDDFVFPKEIFSDESESILCSTECECQFGCGVRFCSPECRGLAWAEYHSQLCPTAYKMSTEETTTAILLGSMSLDAPEKMNDNACSDTCCEKEGHDHHHDHGDHATIDDDIDESTINMADLFIRQAESTNEIFLLGGKVYAKILSTWRQNGQNMLAAMRPYLAFHSRPWWEVVIEGIDPEEKNDPDFDPEEIQHSLRQHLGESLQILRGLLIQHAASDREKPSQQDLDMLFDLDFYANLIGSFELNNISVEIDNPVRDLLMIVCTMQDETARERLKACLLPAVNAFKVAEKAREILTEQDELDSDDESDSGSDSDSDSKSSHASDVSTEQQLASAITQAQSEIESLSSFDVLAINEIVPPCDGTCIMALTCSANHSCMPNAEVSYPSGNREATITATSSIPKGQEVLICYIDEHGDYVQRSQELRHYGFTCQCPRCIAKE